MNVMLIFAHRWIGVALALFMLTWISSGTLIAFVEAPSISPGLRLLRTQALEPREGWLSLGEALARSAVARRGEPGNDAGFADARLRRLDGTPAWIIEDGRGQRFAISAIDGGLIEVTPQKAERIASAWLEVEAEEAPDISYIGTIDAPIGLRNAEALKPFHRFAVDDGLGTQVIVSARTGEVVQKLTRTQRAVAYAGNWLHLFRWLDSIGAADYRRGALSCAGFLAATAALTGLVVGWIRWRPGLFGRPTYLGGRVQPFREFWLKYHFWAGLLGGTFALSWAASGFLSTNPGQIFSSANTSPAELSHFRGERPAAIIWEWKPGAPLAISEDVLELQWSRLGDAAKLFALTRRGERRRVDLQGTIGSYSEAELLAAAGRVAGETKIAAHELIDSYDAYYYPNHRQTAEDKPLPALRVDLADAKHSSFYLDPLQGRLVAKLDDSLRWRRWLYSAAHHWDFGWFRNAGVWSVWIGTCIGSVIVLSLSALVLGWRRLRRSVRPVTARFPIPRIARVTKTSAAPSTTQQVSP
ncbi:PepSY domain-containing protein [Methylocystis bryophila]|uniref:Peptidase n=1 Tax=Methylocystis bryophila TaxID=655015 RepID=A0A1W6MSG1_9HYPH|nr:PepSY domain-containing protein [Methylocystis bryophila]ARN80476.1 hypothetical protein B1812_04640 [Methylocystis bryophila]BDV40498.1 hypothetical protein DSM21852_37510 [Methylocystis bryophila]